ncbi:MAG: glutamine synthetase [Brevibacterium sp.]
MSNETTSTQTLQCHDWLPEHVHPESGELVFLATSDLSAHTRGRAVRAESLKKSTSVGWVPANLGIGPSGHITDDIPFDSSGDLRLLPDFDSAVRTTAIPGQPPLTIVFADQVNTNGTPWHGDARSFLKQTIAELSEEFGVTVKAAFEHEFTDLGNSKPTQPFSLLAHRALEPIGSEVMAALAEMNAKPENWLPEYAPNQFEVTVSPAPALTAADRAVLVRDTVAAVFSGHDRDVTFTPVPFAGDGGSGVHVHFGLYDAGGDTLIFDADRPGRISERAGRFAAGVVKYAPSLTAVFAPLVVSYQRLKPHNWSTAASFLGLQNREALLRIVPTNEIDGQDPRPQLHFEFRGGDIGANPYLLLAILLKAGMEGLRQNLDPAEVVVGDPESADTPPGQLPDSLVEALDLLESDEVVKGWFHPEFLATYLAVKRAEIAEFDHLEPAEQCSAYSTFY